MELNLGYVSPNRKVCLGPPAAENQQRVNTVNTLLELINPGNRSPKANPKQQV